MTGKIAVANAGKKLINSIIKNVSILTINKVPTAAIMDSIIIIIFLLYLSDKAPIIGLNINPPVRICVNGGEFSRLFGEK